MKGYKLHLISFNCIWVTLLNPLCLLHWRFFFQLLKAYIEVSHHKMSQFFLAKTFFVSITDTNILKCAETDLV